MIHPTVLRIAAAAVLALPAAAQAAEPVAFEIRGQALDRALVALAVQAHVSVASAAAQGCGPSPGVTGRLPVEAALRQLLAGTGCDFRRIDARTFLIIRVPAPTQAPRSDPPPPPAPPQPTQMSELVVTAPRRPVVLTRAPYGLTVVTGHDLEAGLGRDTADLSAQVTGLTVTNFGAGRNKLFLRGLSDSPVTGLTQSMVGIYLDESRLTFDAPDPDLRLTDIERIEVLRGPQGALYGSGSMGGIVQIVTRPPDLDRAGGEATASAEATDGGGPGHGLDLVLNAPILPGRLALRLVGYDDIQGGYINDIALGQTHVGAVHRRGGRVGVLYRFNEDWSLRGSFISQRIVAADSRYAFETLQDDQRALRLPEPSRNNLDGGAMTLTGRLGPVDARLTSSLQRHSLASRYDASTSAALFGGGPGPAAYDAADRMDTVEHELVLISRTDAPIRWLLGAFLSDYTHARDAELTQGSATQRLYKAHRDDHTDEYALFGEVSLPLNDRLTTTLGGRLFRLSVETAARSEVSGTTTDVFGGRSRNSGFAPKLLVEYRFDGGAIVYALAAEGYRADGFNAGGRDGRQFRSPGQGPRPFRRFAGDELDSYELGARFSLLQRALSVRLAVFDVEWRSVQSDRIGVDGLPLTLNIGDGRNRGLEAEVAYAFGRWRGGGSLLINDPEVVRPDPDAGLTGDKGLPGVPDLALGLTVRRDLTVLGQPVYVAAAIGYVGPSRLVISQGASSAMGGYATTELSAGWQGADWSLQGRVSNLADSAGDTFNYGNPFLLGHTEVTSPQRPVSISLQASRHFW